jgi:nucleotide-binding universal stress UspA family protein
MYGKIVVGHDLHDGGRDALALGRLIAEATGARLRLVAVAERPHVVPGKGAGADQGRHELESAIEEIARQRLEEGASSIPDDVSVEATLVSGDPVVKLAEAARGDGGLLVIGSRAYGPVRRVLLGSVSSALVRSAPCPLLVLPRGSDAKAEAG